VKEPFLLSEDAPFTFGKARLLSGKGAIYRMGNASNGGKWLSRTFESAPENLEILPDGWTPKEAKAENSYSRASPPRGLLLVAEEMASTLANMDDLIRLQLIPRLPFPTGPLDD